MKEERREAMGKGGRKTSLLPRIRPALVSAALFSTMETFNCRPLLKSPAELRKGGRAREARTKVLAQLRLQPQEKTQKKPGKDTLWVIRRLRCRPQRAAVTISHPEADPEWLTGMRRKSFAHDFDLEVGRIRRGGGGGRWLLRRQKNHHASANTIPGNISGNHHWTQRGVVQSFSLDLRRSPTTGFRVVWLSYAEKTCD